MTQKATAFEKQISRIYELLKNGSDEVTWNDKISDPDNPKQLRQIDITIKGDNLITHIECRSHKVRQNTKWIEELYGRKISLNATSMIAVSDSGFTEGAVKKAKRFGIFLRNLNELSEKEIKIWGKKTRIRWYYYVFKNISICYFVKNIKGLNLNEIQKYIFSKPEYMDSLFNTIKYRFNEDKQFVFPYCFNHTLNVTDVEIIGRNVQKISIKGEVEKVAYEYECPIVFQYHPLNEPNSPSIASIETTKNSNVEIIKTTAGISAISFDLSVAPQAPPNAVLAGIFKFSSIPASKSKPPKFNVVGTHEQEVYINEAKFTVAELTEIT